MTELEKYIRDNAAGFDGMEPAEGHEERFLAKLEAQSARKSWRIILATLAAAATLAGVFFAGSSFGHFTGRNPEAIYLAYMTEVSKLYKDAPMEDSAAWDDALAQLTEEAVPLFEQLPQELSRRRKARILKEYYGNLLDGAKSFVNQ